ncbi:MAG TPA: hypothetical protein VFB45_05495 [Pseudolabrys sp.]|nr:hypothetical protein [Pseudolabrys sp.]
MTAALSAAGLVFGMVWAADDALACGNGYGANYSNCGMGGGGVRYRNGGGGGGYDVGGAINAGIAVLNAAGPLLNDLGNMANNMPQIEMPQLPAPNLAAPSGGNLFPSPFDASKPATTAEHAADCRGMRARLQPHALSEDWIVDQMARSGCQPNGKPMSLRERLKRRLAAKSQDNFFGNPNPVDVLNGMVQPPPDDQQSSTNRRKGNKRRNNQSDITGLGR